MSKIQKHVLAAQAKQAVSITPADKRYMIIFTTTLVMLSAAVIISSYTV
ncbi:MAG: hypothetical protein OEY11_05450 [Gammaproteobacteria bacterium]|nr:hypothetical protein [Gammaproteobacteria bacterium]